MFDDFLHQLVSGSLPSYDHRVLALAPQVELASFINKLFWFFSLPAVFVKCSL